jgi:hypothetical protein
VQAGNDRNTAQTEARSAEKKAVAAEKRAVALERMPQKLADAEKETLALTAELEAARAAGENKDRQLTELRASLVKATEGRKAADKEHAMAENVRAPQSRMSDVRSLIPISMAPPDADSAPC